MSEHIKPEQSMALRALAHDDPERQQAEAHARSCAACRAALDEATLMLGWVDTYAPIPAVDPALKARMRSLVLSAQTTPDTTPRTTPSRATRTRAHALPKWLLAAGMALSALFAWLAGEPGAPAPALGMECILFEQLIAVGPFAFAAYLGMRGKIALEPLNLATVSMAGALAGQVLLHFRCASHATPHLFAFHVLGVGLAAILGYGATTRLVRTR